MRAIVAASIVVGLQATSGAEPIPLRGGESRTHEIALERGQALVGDVLQQGIDVVVTVLRTDGTAAVAVDSPNGTDGSEPVAFVATDAGTHRVEVKALEAAAPPGASMRTDGATRGSREVVQSAS